MTWLAWRQFRTQAIVALGLLAAMGVVMLVTGLHLRDLYDTSGIVTCKVHRDCTTVEASFLAHESFLRNLLGPLLLTIPVLTGIFWGAPLLARELENGTHRLAWTQSVTRTRWLATKLALVGLASIAVAELFSLMVSWWFSPIDKVNMNRLTQGVFDERGIVAIGYAAFAFALGVAAGALIRRTLPAMAATLLGFLGVRLVMTYLIRAHLISPAHTTTPLEFGPNLGFEAGPSGVTFVTHNPSIPNAWVLSSRITDQAGHTPTSQSIHRFLQTACPSLGTPQRYGGSPPSEAAFQACVARLSAKFHLAATYQPPSRYWPLQGLETAIFLGLALTLTGFCFWWVRHRLT